MERLYVASQRQSNVHPSIACIKIYMAPQVGSVSAACCEIACANMIIDTRSSCGTTHIIAKRHICNSKVGTFIYVDNTYMLS